MKGNFSVGMFGALLPQLTRRVEEGGWVLRGRAWTWKGGPWGSKQQVVHVLLGISEGRVIVFMGGHCDRYLINKAQWDTLVLSLRQAIVFGGNYTHE